MEPTRFDILIRALSDPPDYPTRRRLLAITGHVLLRGVAAIPALGVDRVDAKHKKRKKRCKAPQKKCGGKCVAIQNDERNCGECGNRCASGQSCTDGQCTASRCHDNEVCNGDGRCRDGQCHPKPDCRSNGETFPQGDGQCCSENVDCQVGTTNIECTCMPGELGNDCLVDGDCRSGSCVGYQCIGCPTGQIACGGRRVSLESQSNCGACGLVCDREDYCQAQQCKPRYDVDATWPGGSPDRVFVDSDHTVDSHNHRIQLFARNGGWLGSIGNGSGSGPYQFIYPSDIAVDTEGNFYVADYGNDRVQKFNSSGTYWRTFGGVQGSGNGQLSGPAGVAVDRQGNVYVADRFNDRVQKFDSEGGYLQTFGSNGTDPGQLFYPSGCAVASTGDVFIADYLNERVQQFAERGQLVRVFDQAPLQTPWGVAVDDQDNLYIADQDYGIVRFKLTAPKPS